MLGNIGLIGRGQLGAVGLHFLCCGVLCLQHDLRLQQVAQLHDALQASEIRFTKPQAVWDVGLVLEHLTGVEVALGGLAVLHQLDGVALCIGDDYLTEPLAIGVLREGV